MRGRSFQARFVKIRRSGSNNSLTRITSAKRRAKGDFSFINCDEHECLVKYRRESFGEEENSRGSSTINSSCPVQKVRGHSDFRSAARRRDNSTDSLSRMDVSKL